MLPSAAVYTSLSFATGRSLECLVFRLGQGYFLRLRAVERHFPWKVISREDQILARVCQTSSDCDPLKSLRAYDWSWFSFSEHSVSLCSHTFFDSSILPCFMANNFSLLWISVCVSPLEHVTKTFSVPCSDLEPCILDRQNKIDLPDQRHNQRIKVSTQLAWYGTNV